MMKTILAAGLATLLAVPCLGLAEGAAADAPPAIELPPLDVLEGDKVHSLLPPDAIPAIDDPTFAPAGEADFMADDEPIVGVIHNGVAKAYSLWHLDRHEIVNDDFSGEPVAVTW